MANRIHQQQGLLGNVACAADANVSLSSPPTAIDGVTISAGDKVLLAAQANPVENGIYFYTGSVLSRPIHDENLASGYTDLAIGSRVFVVAGTTYGQTEWIFSATDSTQLDGYEIAVATIDTHTQVDSKLSNSEGGTVFGFACSDETTALSTGQKFAVDMPSNMKVTTVYASVVTAGTTSSITVDVNDEGVSLLNAPLSITAGSNNAETSTFAAAATSYTLSKGDLLTVDIDAVDSGGTGAGLKIFLVGTVN